MIKIVENSKEKQEFYLDGKYEEMVEISGLDYFINNQETSKRLKRLRFSDFPPLANITFNDYFEWCEIENFVFFAFDEELINEENTNLDEFNFGIRPNLLEWTFSFSFADYRAIFIKIWEEINTLGGEIWRFDVDEPAISIVFPPCETTSAINEYVLPYEKIFEECHKRTLEIINKRKLEEQIISYFDFPKEIKISCEQYLLYFAQFLQDLGINATSNLKEEAGKVLFSVTPTDDAEALDKIREALAIYLKLPESPIVFDYSFKSMRMQQQIENLQHSQKMMVREIQVNEKLLLAQSDMIREKNITISQQQIVVENQNKIIEKISSRSIMMDSVENKEELEKIYDGLEAGHSKWLYELTGIKANFIKMISTSVKNTFPKDEKKSVLGLDED